MSLTVQFLSSLSQASPHEWNALAGEHTLLRHEFLSAFESHNCVGDHAGWTPRHLAMYRGNSLCAAMPLYLKTHSRGEYVFDFSWADAYARHGLAYYPKLLCAVPFTPVTGPRLLAHDAHDKRRLIDEAIGFCRTGKLSSLHILFPDTQDSALLGQHGLLERRNVQFHWHNQDYASYDAYLAGLSQPKRKKLKQAAKYLEQAGIRFVFREASAITPDDWSFFYRCYRHTYHERGQLPYLNPGFFRQVHRNLPQAFVLVLAYHQNEPVACALNIRSGDTLYGRYWGCRQFVSGLHFETCYAQGIRYCITHGLRRFEGGAQGEHKLARGLLPATTRSYHWISHPRFAQAIDDYLTRETLAIDDYRTVLLEHSPYRRTE